MEQLKTEKIVTTTRDIASRWPFRISVVLSVVSVRVTPEWLKKGHDVVCCQLSLIACCLLLLFASLSRTNTRLKHLFFILVVQISNNILHLFRNCCKFCTLGAEIKISAPRA